MTVLPHIAPPTDPTRDRPQPLPPEAGPRTRLWRPARVVIAEAAEGTPVAAHAEAAAARMGAEIVRTKGNRVTGLRGATERETYRRAKSTLAVVMSPPSAARFQPIPPSADFRLDLATGCPAHCQYCYLAGSLSGPPVTRAYADVDRLLAAVPDHVGRGRVTSASEARAHEGTTFEASCYTDPLGIEHLTGSLARAIRWFADRPDAALRFTTKFAAVEPLLGLPHGGRTRARFSVNAEGIARRHEGGTDPLAARLRALGRMARAGYPVGLTVAPIMPLDGWAEAYDDLMARAAAELPEGADLTLELITHRFTPGSKEVLTGWYPGSTLEMDPAVRTQKRNKFGGVKYVYPKALMHDMRRTLEASAARHLPGARLLYWT